VSADGIRSYTDKEEPNACVYNWTSLFLGEINTGTWSSRMGES
jgi:hypothetical protein